jgi:hypothetical protein
MVARLVEDVSHHVTGTAICPIQFSGSVIRVLTQQRKGDACPDTGGGLLEDPARRRGRSLLERGTGLCRRRGTPAGWRRWSGRERGS